MKRPRLVVALVLIAVVVAVCLQNTQTVETRILFATLAMPRAFLLLGTLSMGLLAGFLLGARFQRRRAR